MSTRLKLATAAAGTLLASSLVVATLRLSPEPTYKGLTMRQCLRSSSSEAYEGVHVLGTNNLPLLVKRVAYDPKTDIPAAFLYRLYRLTRSTRIHDIASRGINLAEDAHEVFDRLGPKAAPAIPDLAKIAEHAGEHPSRRAMRILMRLGEGGVAAVASRATNGDTETRLYAVHLLWCVNSSPARLALTKALDDPDNRVRYDASQALAWCQRQSTQPDPTITHPDESTTPVHR